MSEYLLLSPYENEHGITSNYLQGDTQEKHIYNRNRFGSKWLWDKATIEYKMNSHGYRMEKELDKIDFDNYYAFFGCSFTVGIGLPLTTTFPYMISDKNKVDYVNGAVGGASPSFCYYNFIQLMHNAPKRPKYVIINWPPITRQCYWYDDELQFKGPNFSTNSHIDYWNETYQNVIMEESHLYNTFDNMRKAIVTMCALSDVKLFQCSPHEIDYKRYPDIHIIPVDTYTDLSPNEFNSVDIINMRCARDVNTDYIGHPGLFYQTLIYDKFTETMV